TPLQAALAHRECVQQVEGLQAHRNAIRQARTKLPCLRLSCRRSRMVDLMSLDPSLAWFAIGVAAACLAMGFGYVTNYCIAGMSNSRLRLWEHPYLANQAKTKWWRMFATTFHLLSVVLAIISIGLFVF